MLYFAYGSCMDKNDLDRILRNEEYKVVGSTKLNNYRQAYNAYSSTRKGGVLDIEKFNGSHVIGILYELYGDALKKLDIREGQKYKRIQVEVTCDNKKLKAFTYVIKEKQATRADIGYSGIVYHAMIDNSFSEDYIDSYIRLVRISAYGSEAAYFKYKELKRRHIYG